MALENPGKLSEFFSPTLWPPCKKAAEHENHVYMKAVCQSGDLQCRVRVTDLNCMKLHEFSLICKIVREWRKS